MGNRLFVGNLSFDTTEESLRAAIAPHGTVTKVRVMTDRDTGRSRGFAFVDMSDDEAAKRVISTLNGTSIDGRQVRVDEAAERSDSRGRDARDGRRR
jgi:RNA recognition motif-containing protein